MSHAQCASITWLRRYIVLLIMVFPSFPHSLLFLLHFYPSHFIDHLPFSIIHGYAEALRIMLLIQLRIRGEIYWRRRNKMWTNVWSILQKIDCGEDCWLALLARPSSCRRNWHIQPPLSVLSTYKGTTFTLSLSSLLSLISLFFFSFVHLLPLERQ